MSRPAATATLYTTFPCCGGRCRLDATGQIPYEQYDRICGWCGKAWTVTRTTVLEAPADTRDSDSLTWDIKR